MTETTWEEKIKYAVSRAAKSPDLEYVVAESIIGTVKHLLQQNELQAS